MLTGCGLSVPTAYSVATLAPNSMQTIIAETAAAAQTQTAQFITPTKTLTPTPTASRTPTKTPLPTSTVLFLFTTDTPVVLPTQTFPGNSDTGSSGGSNVHNYHGTIACALVGQSPADGVVFRPRQKFTVVWTIKNTGTASWKEHTIDYRFLGGDKFHDGPSLYDFKYILDPGETYGISIPMHAPKTAGSYQTTWAMSLKKGGLCKMSLSIIVQ